MVRAFAIAPTASCSYRSQDADGYTCYPEIAPPIARTVDRDSGTFGVQTYNYGDVEIASEVGWDALQTCSRWNHASLPNQWTSPWILISIGGQIWLSWMRTSLKSGLGLHKLLSITLQVMGDVQDKTNAYAAIAEDEVDDYLNSILTNEPQCDCAE
jgi:hypothetical protein